MKNLVLLASMLIGVFTFAQENEINEVSFAPPRFQSEIFESVNDFLSYHTEYPAVNKNAGVQGTEIISFKVSVEGKISDFKIVNSVSPEIDEEVKSLLLTTDGKWTAGVANETAVEMQKEVSLAFYLNSPGDMVKTAKNHLKKGNHLMYVKNKPANALKSYNSAALILPNDETILAARILCNYELKDFENANEDLNRLRILSERKGWDSETETFADLDLFVKNMK